MAMPPTNPRLAFQGLILSNRLESSWSVCARISVFTDEWLIDCPSDLDFSLKGTGIFRYQSDDVHPLLQRDHVEQSNQRRPPIDPCPLSLFQKCRTPWLTGLPCTTGLQMVSLLTALSVGRRIPPAIRHAIKIEIRILGYPTPDNFLIWPHCQFSPKMTTFEQYRTPKSDVTLSKDISRELCPRIDSQLLIKISPSIDALAKLKR